MTPELERAARAPGMGRWVLRRVLRGWGGRLAIVALAALIVAAVAAPLIAPYDPYQVGAGRQFEAPSHAHLFGTDELGRDVFSRMLYGARISLTVSLLSAWGALLIAFPLGLVAGYAGGVTDLVVSRLFDTIFAFPSILLGIALVAIRGASEANIIFAVAVIYVPTLGRLTRVTVLTQQAEEYVVAARALGAANGHILRRHLMPNALPPLLVQMTLIMADAVLLEASFSFLGLGIRPPKPSWGVILDAGRNYLSQAPWLGIFAGLTITIMILALNALGDSLRLALDPRRP